MRLGGRESGCCLGRRVGNLNWVEEVCWSPRGLPGRAAGRVLSGPVPDGRCLLAL